MQGGAHLVSISNVLNQRLFALVLLLLALVTAPPVRAETPVLRHYTISGWAMEDGLPHPLVHAIAQDRDGFIWAGTWEGAVRFNGRDFTVYDRQNTPAELSGVYSILPEKDGGILFGTTSAGVYRYFQGRWEPLGQGEARKLRVRALLRDRIDGAIWIVTGQKLLRLDRNGVLHNTGDEVGLHSVKVVTIAQDAQGALLVAGERGVQRLLGNKLTPWGSDWLPSDSIMDLIQDGRGGWLAAGDGGVAWKQASGQVQHFVNHQRVDRVVLDRNGVLWMAMASGALMRQDSMGEKEAQRVNIPGTLSPALFVDREGLVWLGGTDGLFRVAEGAGSGITHSDGLSSDYIRSVLQDRAGTVWIGQANGLSRWRNGKIENLTLTQAKQGRQASVLALAQAHDGVWVGTYDQGVFKVDQAGRVLSELRLPGLRQPLIRALLEDPDSSLWVGGNHGLVRIQRNGKRLPYLDASAQASDMVQALYRGADGMLWVGTANGMVSIAPDGVMKRWRPDIEIPANYVFDFLEDSNGDLWIASERGLLRKRGTTFNTYDHHVGMPRDKVFRILDDGAGNLWLSSNMGVFRIARSEFDRVDTQRSTTLAVHVVDKSDGMPGSQCNGASMPAGWRMHDGTLLFPTSAGVALIDPQSAERDGESVPKVALESIAVDGVPRSIGKQLQLRAGESRLQIHFAGLSFRAPDKLRYRYRLHGYDRAWVESDSGNEAVYTGLPPGNYRLQVQSMALPLDWSKQDLIGETELAIVMQPALWQRTWVRAAAAGVVLLIIVLALWWRSASFRRAQRRLGRIIAERTEELSEKNRQLEVAGFRLQFQASHDDLTGLPNRRAGDKFLNERVAQAQEERAPLSVALLDIDHFKRVNEHYGHPAGDAVLQHFAQHLSEFAAEWGVFVARFGGEEFLICMDAFGVQDATHKIRLLLAKVAENSVVLADGTAIGVTFSAGVTELQPEHNAYTLFTRADDLLLKAKQAGRNQVMSD